MSAADIKASYRDACQQTVTLRVYSGLGATRTHSDYTAAGNAQVYGATELSPGIAQGDVKCIVITDDLVTAGLTLPVTTSDKFKLVVDAKEYSIKAVLTRKALDGTLIAYELQGRG